MRLIAEKPPTESPRGRLDRIDGAILLALVAAVFATFLPALSAEFLQWDDQEFVVNNTHVHGLNMDNVRWMLKTMHAGHYHPLTFASWGLDYELWGLKPFGYHLQNILLHAANASALYVLLLHVFAVAWAGSEREASLNRAAFKACVGIGAAFFAMHPFRVESVAWVTERRDVLSATFLLLAAVAYLRSAQIAGPGIRSTRAWIATIVVLALSCLAKSWGMTFFALAFVLDAYPLRRLPIEPWLWLSAKWRGTFGRLLIEKLPLMAIGIITAALAATAQNQALASKALEQWSIGNRLVQSIYGLWFYLYRTVVPTEFSPLYQLPKRLDPTEPKFLIAYAMVAIVLVGLIMVRKRAPGLVAAAGLYVLTLLPVLGILQSGDQFVADRYSYLACMGFSGIVAAGLWKLFERADRAAREEQEGRARFVQLGLVLSTAVAGILGILTSAQASTWQSTEKLWSHAIRVTPTSLVYVNYAVEMLRKGDTEEGVAALVLAVQEDPTDGRAWFTLADVLREQKRFGEAERAYIEAAKHMPQAYMAFTNLGDLYFRDLHKPTEGIAALRKAVADVERPGRRKVSYLAYVALGSALWQTGQFDEARTVLTKALAYDEVRAHAQHELDLLAAERRRRAVAPKP